MEDAKVKNEHKGIVDLTNATLEIKEGVFHITGKKDNLIVNALNDLNCLR